MLFLCFKSNFLQKLYQWKIGPRKFWEHGFWANLKSKCERTSSLAKKMQLYLVHDPLPEADFRGYRAAYSPNVPAGGNRLLPLIGEIFSFPCPSNNFVEAQLLGKGSTEGFGRTFDSSMPSFSIHLALSVVLFRATMDKPTQAVWEKCALSHY